jgi:protein transport protein SEC31
MDLFYYFSVQHILASTFGPRCVVWDLRKNEPIIKLTDSTSRVSISSNLSHYVCKYDQWHVSVHSNRESVRLHVLTVASMKMTAFWVIALCSLIEVDHLFRGLSCLHH